MEKMIKSYGWVQVNPDHPALKGAAINNLLYRKEGTNLYLWYKPRENYICIVLLQPIPNHPEAFATAVRYQGRADNPAFFKLLHEMLNL